MEQAFTTSHGRGKHSLTGLKNVIDQVVRLSRNMNGNVSGLDQTVLLLTR